MATRSAQWHPSYNPVTHTGEGEPAQDRPRGVKITSKPASMCSNLVGAACRPAEACPGGSSSPTAHSPTQAKLSPARVDHLTGAACTPSSSSSTEPAGEGGSRQHGSGKAVPKVVLRAAVDHMQGVACAVQAVAAVATADAPQAQLQRGMTTKLTKDRMVAQQSREHMNSSRLYSLGAGYTPELSGAANSTAAPVSWGHGHARH